MPTDILNHCASTPSTVKLLTTTLRTNSMPPSGTHDVNAGRMTSALTGRSVYTLDSELKFPVMPSMAETIGNLVWASMYSAMKWTAASVVPRSPVSAFTQLWRQWWCSGNTTDSPPQYPGLQYGFLQGTFGLPYGGYLVQPPRGALGSTLVLSDSMNMFSVLGTQTEIVQCLHDMHAMVFCKTMARSFTSDIVVEMYTKPRSQAPGTGWGYHAIPFLGHWFDSLFTQQRQLVIRSGRTFMPSDLKPLVRIRIPQGVTLSEIAGVLESSIDSPHAAARDGNVDLTRDKAINIRVMGRSRSASLLGIGCSDDSDDLFDTDADAAACSLPPYQRYDGALAHSSSTMASSSHPPPPAYYSP
ncbi:hypothetical protein IW140_003538 [Coemansia sp. RSA 1813]|nr:hypothetical protein EV178_003374 [Coemansia sp. RSA 1646]KAJ1772952.1 hypothetical protein LPJ74_001093 [Coemansia sp. RSA 1843]KAJ2093528.1 hypothetical protein IW138_000381 [Coemansia sp. RSA 986]KAJ2214345.1 hypothetical protein EV179_003127 [Coemansia sp. RSA 487]KAJ2568912.1 hypothetical protein IW140_003538 [Coemansia sp. RSA 1813]